uniref:Uncharacterized protein n=1 Tax=Aquila chrysaetos chrysaetos TaxID=223781 RepID=A0A663DNH4_AQUCH
MALELVEGGGGGLVEEQGHGASLVGFGDQDGVAAQHHRLVLHLVPVNPGEDFGVPAVGGAVSDAVQEVRVARPAGSLLAGGHTDALGSQRQLHLGPSPKPECCTRECTGVRRSCGFAGGFCSRNPIFSPLFPSQPDLPAAPLGLSFWLLTCCF